LKASLPSFLFIKGLSTLLGFVSVIISTELYSKSYTGELFTLLSFVFIAAVTLSSSFEAHGIKNSLTSLETKEIVLLIKFIFFIMLIWILARLFIDDARFWVELNLLPSICMLTISYGLSGIIRGMGFKSLYIMSRDLIFYISITFLIIDSIEQPNTIKIISISASLQLLFSLSIYIFYKLKYLNSNKTGTGEAYSIGEKLLVTMSTALSSILTFGDIYYLSFFLSPSDIGAYTLLVKSMFLMIVPLFVMNVLWSNKVKKWKEGGLEKYIKENNNIILILLNACTAISIASLIFISIRYELSVSVFIASFLLLLGRYANVVVGPTIQFMKVNGFGRDYFLLSLLTGVLLFVATIVMYFYSSLAIWFVLFGGIIILRSYYSHWLVGYSANIQLRVI